MQCPSDTFLGVQPTLVKPAHFVEGHGTPGTHSCPLCLQKETTRGRDGMRAVPRG